MNTNHIITEINTQIEALEKARTLLEINTVAVMPQPILNAEPRKRGRPRKHFPLAMQSAEPQPPISMDVNQYAPRRRRRHGVSPEGRQRISDAMKRVWAKRKAILRERLAA